MKNWMLLVLLTLFACTVSTDGYAQRRYVQPPSLDVVRASFRAFDTNNDELVNRAEIIQNGTARFDRLDQDKDGSVTPGEYRNYAAARSGYNFTSIQGKVIAGGFIRYFDEDRNSAVSSDEYILGFQRAVLHWDVDEDGVITFEEYFARSDSLHAPCGCPDY